MSGMQFTILVMFSLREGGREGASRDGGWEGGSKGREEVGMEEGLREGTSEEGTERGRDGGEEEGREQGRDRVSAMSEGGEWEGGKLQGMYTEEDTGQYTVYSIQCTKQPTTLPMPLRLWYFKYKYLYGM